MQVTSFYDMISDEVQIFTHFNFLVPFDNYYLTPPVYLFTQLSNKK